MSRVRPKCHSIVDTMHFRASSSHRPQHKEDYALRGRQERWKSWFPSRTMEVPHCDKYSIVPLATKCPKEPMQGNNGWESIITKLKLVVEGQKPPPKMSLVMKQCLLYPFTLSMLHDKSFSLFLFFVYGRINN
jgi:hypothetical protein